VSSTLRISPLPICVRRIPSVYASGWLLARAVNARRLVLKHWDAIERVAQALIERETLTGAEVVGIIRQAL
jgi:hypothetical protein